MINIRLEDQLKQLKLIIFDIDGVLVDVSSSYRLAIKHTAEFFYQKEIKPTEIQKLKNETGFNNDWDLTLELLKRKGLTPSREQIIEKFQSFYWGNKGDGYISAEQWLLDHDLLKSLSNKYSLAILTGRPRLEAKFALNKNKVTDYFTPLITMEDVRNGKPNPEGLIKILNSLSFSSKEACYIGDTFDDVRTAKSVNMLFIGAIPPGGAECIIPYFFKEGASAVFRSINELSQYI